MRLYHLRIPEFPSFLSVGSAAGYLAGLSAVGLMAVSVRGCFLRVLALVAVKSKGQRKSRIPKHNFLGILEF